MGSFKVRHLVGKPHRNPTSYYFQPSKAMKTGGYRAENLGKDLATAIARVNELNAQWDAERIGIKKPARGLPPPGTVAHFIEDLRRSRTAFLDKSPARQDEMEYSFKHILKVFGPSQLRAITTDHVELFYNGLRNTSSEHKAARIMKDLRYIFSRAFKTRKIQFDPTQATTVKQPKARKQKWTPEQVELAINTAWDAGYRGAAVAMAIAYDTGLSPVDVRTLTMGQIQGDRLNAVSRTKTDQRVEGQLWPETLDWIAAYHDDLGIASAPSGLVIRTRRGKPYTKDILAKDIRTVRRMVGLPEELQLRDMRRTATIEEIEGGATTKQVAAARGWAEKSAGKMSDTYGPANFEMAKAAHDQRPRNLKGPKR